MELLAPVGSQESLKAAVENGADAVYLGGKMFSARSSAANFSLLEIEEALAYAHLRGVRIYVAVNTLIANEEIKELYSYLKSLEKIKVDAVIVQDLGVLHLIRNYFPQLPLHISTQMTVHNLEGVKFLEKKGIKRIVLSRELSQQEISFIKAHTEVELEVFVHGALCISYSGQCLMSSMIGGRSGNRGKCAQPCRLPYKLVDSRDRILVDEKEIGSYLLSPRDMKLINYLPELYRSGIDSLKIEGRMKRPEYVATVVRVYRQAIDRMLNQPDNFLVDPEEEKELAQIFNRDFTSQYFHSRSGKELMSYRRPNNRGIYLGRIEKYQDGLAFIKLDDNLAKGDGIEVWVSQGGRVGKTIDSLKVNGEPRLEAFPGELAVIKVEGKIRPGDRIFKTSDERLNLLARQSFTSPAPHRKFPLKIWVKARLGEPLTILVKNEEGLEGKGQTEFKAEKALKRPLTREFLWEHLSKLGNTIFNLSHLGLDIEGELMVPVSEINQARRQAIEELEKEIISSFTRKDVSFNKKNELFFPRKVTNKEQVNSKPGLAVLVGDWEGVKLAADEGANRIYFGGDLIGKGKAIDISLWQKALEYCSSKGVELYFSTPRIIKNQEIAGWKSFFAQLENWLPSGVLVSNLGLLNILKEQFSFPIAIDYPLNIFNNLALRFLEDNIKPVGITLSTELTLKQLEEFDKDLVPLEVLVEGYLPLMVMEHCPFNNIMGTGQKEKCPKYCLEKEYYLKDRLGVNFSLYGSPFCRTYLLNSVPLSMLENLRDLKGIGLSSLRIEGYGLKNLKELVRVYRQAIDLVWRGENHLEDYQIKEFLSKERDAFTKGHYYRGV